MLEVSVLTFLYILFFLSVHKPIDCSDFITTGPYSLSSIPVLWLSTLKFLWTLSLARCRLKRTFLHSSHQALQQSRNLTTVARVSRSSPWLITPTCVNDSADIFIIAELFIFNIIVTFAALPTYENGLFTADLREEGDTEHLNIGYDTIFTPNYITYTSCLNSQQTEEKDETAAWLFLFN